MNPPALGRAATELLLFAVALVAAAAPHAQEGESANVRTRIDFEAGLPPLADTDAVRNWVDSELRQQLGLGEADQLVVDEQPDAMGDYTVFRVSQAARDLPVVYRESRLLLNSENAPVHLLGHHSPFPDVPSDQPQLSSQEAFEAAGGAASALSSSRLVYWPSPTGLRLAYELEGRFADPASPTASHQRVYVDAMGGDVLQRLPLAHQAVERKVYDFSHACRDKGIRTRMNASTALALLRESPLVRSESHAGNHGNAERLFEILGDYHTFLAVILGIDSFDGEGKPLVGYVGARFHPQTGHLPQCVGDAFQAVWFPGDYAVLADEALDFPELIGHEFTHGLISHGSGLVYLHRPGALNESISDVVGATFRGWRENLAPLAPDAEIAMSPSFWQLRYPQGVVRDMQDPQRVRLPDGTTMPDHYDDYRYLPRDIDFGGVHINSSILNLGFHLLAEGGQHPRRRGGPAVEAIGAMRAVRIFAAAAAWILQPASDFEDARYAFAYAAEAYYGPGSREWVAVHTAMDAVGIPGDWEVPAVPEVPEAEAEVPEADPEVVARESDGTAPEPVVSTPDPGGNSLELDPRAPDPGGITSEPDAPTPNPEVTIPEPEVASQDPVSPQRPTTPTETEPLSEPAPETEPPPAQSPLPSPTPQPPVRNDETASFQTAALVLLAVVLIGAIVVAYASRPGKRAPNRVRSASGAQPREPNAVRPSPSVPIVGSLRPIDGLTAIPLSQAQLASPEGLVIGRANSICHVELRDPTVSRRHARLRVIDGAVFVEDLNSLRGTSIAGKNLKPFHPELLAAHQNLGIAEFQFRYQVSR